MTVYADKTAATKTFLHLRQGSRRFISFLFTMYDKGVMKNFNK